MSDEEMQVVSPRVPVLHRLRENAEFSDCTIIVCDDEFPVHSNIVSCLGPFFKTAFLGDFKEAATKRLHIGDTTPEAVSVLLDYAYEVDYSLKISTDISLNVDVWELSHRFSLAPLFNQCVKVATKNLSCANAVKVYEKAKLYECKQEIVERVGLFIAHNFEYSLFYASENVQHLSYGELLHFLKWEECIAHEIIRFYTVMIWYKHRTATEEQLEALLDEVQFELLDTEAIGEVFRDYFQILPKSVLGKMVYAATKRAVQIPQEFLGAPIQEKISVPFSTTLCMEDKYKLRENLIFFRFAHWLFSLQFDLNDEEHVCIKLKCERRQSTRHTCTCFYFVSVRK